MKKLLHTLLLINLIFLTVFSLSVTVLAEESDTVCYRMTFTRGYYFKNPLAPGESEHLFGGVRVGDIEIASGETLTLPENTVTFADYVFVGWKHTSRNGTVTMYQPYDTIKNISEDMTFDAVWERKPRSEIIVTGKLTYDANCDFLYSGETDRVTVSVGDIISVKKNAFVRKGYEFVCWVDGNGNKYNPGDKYTVTKLFPTLYASWKRVETPKYTVIYDPNTADDDEIVFEEFELSELTIIECPFTVPNHYFLYWADDNENRYQPGDVIDISSDIGGGKRLYAVFNEEKIYFDVEVVSFGNGSVTPTGTYTLEEGEIFGFSAVPDDGFEISVVLIGNKKADSSGSYSFKVLENTIVKVVFTEIPAYTVTVDYNFGGSLKINDGKQNYKAGESAKVDIIIDDGYELYRLTDDGRDVTSEVTENTYTVSGIVNNRLVYAEFKKIIVEEPSEEVSENSTEESFSDESEKSNSEKSQTESSENQNNPQNTSKKTVYLLILAVVIVILAVAIVFVIRK